MRPVNTMKPRGVSRTDVTRASTVHRVVRPNLPPNACASLCFSRSLKHTRTSFPAKRPCRNTRVALCRSVNSYCAMLTSSWVLRLLTLALSLGHKIDRTSKLAQWAGSRSRAVSWAGPGP
jgi:hypothetical protein